MTRHLRPHLALIACLTGCGPAVEIKGALSVDEGMDQSGVQAGDGGVRRDAAVDDGHCPLPTLTSLRERLFTTTCAGAGCHGAATPALELDLTLPVAELSPRLRLASKQSLQGLPLVTPGQYGASYLYLKVFLETPVVGQQMPPGAPAEPCAVAALRDWISDGAPD